MKTAVIALGGNAILRANQRGGIADIYENIRSTAIHLTDLIVDGYDIVLAHGNGPQVGRLLIQSEMAGDQYPPFPLDVCVAQSEGEIGYLLSSALDYEMRRRAIDKQAITIITRTVVDKNDNAFKNPTKPIGKYYSREEAELLGKEKKWIFKEDKARGGWRRVVPSPRPVSILEIETIKKLIFGGQSQKEVIIAVGGGGIPVVEENGIYRGVEAVIDKDLAASMLAVSINEKLFIILTDVDAVYMDFKKENSRRIDTITVNELKKAYESNQFPAGSMGPKIEAVINFIENGGEKAIITSPEMLTRALKGESGTTVTK